MKFDTLKQRLGFIRYYLLMFLLIAGVFYAGHEFATKRNHLLTAKIDLLEQSIDNLIDENQRISSELNIKKVELEVASIANKRAQQNIKESLSVENELREQIAFYQNVMAPELSQDGFVIESTEITKTDSDNNYAIRLMMLQRQNIKSVVKGTLNIRLSGSQDGKPKTYKLAELIDSSEQTFDFSFKYFEVLELRITLPQGFVSERLNITTDIFKYRRKRGTYQTEVDWQTALILD